MSKKKWKGEKIICINWLDEGENGEELCGSDEFGEVLGCLVFADV